MTIVPTNRDANEYIRFFKDENAMRCMGQVSHTGLFGAWSDIAPGRYVDYNGPGEGKFSTLVLVAIYPGIDSTLS
jgi:hypothetical protein